MKKKKIPDPLSNKEKWVIRPVKTLWILYGLIGAAFGYNLTYFFPDVTVEEGRSLNESKAFKTMFYVKNNNKFFSIKKVMPSLAIKRLILTNGPTGNNNFIEYTKSVLPELKAGNTDTFMFDLSPMIHGRYSEEQYVKFAKVAFILNYEFLWIKQEDVYYFRVELNESGNAIWTPAPESFDVDSIRYPKTKAKSTSTISLSDPSATP